MWYCKHIWKVVKVFNYIDISYGDKVPSFDLTFQCIKCGDVRVKSFYGAGECKLEDFNKDVEGLKKNV